MTDVALVIIGLSLYAGLRYLGDAIRSLRPENIHVHIKSDGGEASHG